MRTSVSTVDAPSRGRGGKPPRSRNGGSYLALRRVLAIGVVALAWQIVVVLGLAPAQVPRVEEILSALMGALGAANFWISLWQTVSAALAGVAIATAVGIPLGLVIGALPAVERSSRLLLDFGRSFPVLALIPMLILALGATWRMEVLVVALAAIWPILVQSLYGARQVDPSVTAMVQCYQIPRGLWFFRVLLPSSMPYIATGIRISIAISILVAIGVEVLSQTPGLGRLITLAQGGSRWDLAFAYLFLIGLFGWAVTAGVARAEARLLRWNRRDQE